MVFRVFCSILCNFHPYQWLLIGVDGPIPTQTTFSHTGRVMTPAFTNSWLTPEVNDARNHWYMPVIVSLEERVARWRTNTRGCFVCIDKTQALLSQCVDLRRWYSSLFSGVAPQITLFKVVCTYDEKVGNLWVPMDDSRQEKPGQAHNQLLRWMLHGLCPDNSSMR